jgi:parallel beta-helix repeat protein
MRPARTLRTVFPLLAMVAFLALSPAASAGSKLRLTYRGGVLAGTLASPPKAGYRLVLNGHVVRRVHGRKFKFRLRTRNGTNLVIARSVRTGRRLASVKFRVKAVATVAPIGTAGPTHGDPPFGETASASVTPPVVAVTGSGPATGGLVRFAASASVAGSRVSLVDFLVDGAVVGSDSAAPFSFDWNPADLPAGSHVLTAAASSPEGGYSVSAPVSVTTSGQLVATREVSPSQSVSAAIAALPASGGSVHLAPGVYTVKDLWLGNGVQLIGSGPSTVLRPAAGANYDSILNIRGVGVSVRGLTLDGNAAAQTGGEGWGVQVGPGARDVVIRKVQIVDARLQGVYMWGDHQRVSVQDSQIDGGGQARAGVMDQISDAASGDTSVLRTTVRNVRDYGINFFPWTPSRVYPGARALAVGNIVEHVQNAATDNGTNEGGIWTGGAEAVIRDNVVSDTGWDGIQTIGASSHTVIAANHVSRTGVGIYVEHQTWDSLIEGNTLTEITGTGINVEWRYGGEGSGRLTIRRNTITSPGGYGVFIDVAANDNVIDGNVISDARQGAIRLQGTTGNLVTGNDLRGTRQPWCGIETTGMFDDGSLARSNGNQFRGNDCRGARSGAVKLEGATSVASDNLT